MAKIQKPTTKGIVAIALGGVGFLLALIGLCLDFVTFKGAGGLGAGVLDLGGSGAKIPGELISAFAFLTFFAATAACVLAVLRALGIGLPKKLVLAIAIVVIVFAALTVIFDGAFIASLNGGTSVLTIGAAPFLVLIGGVMTGVGCILVK